MKSKHFHEMRIKELEFQRNKKKIRGDKYFTVLTSLLSVVTVFLMFELQSKKKRCELVNTLRINLPRSDSNIIIYTIQRISRR